MFLESKFTILGVSIGKKITDEQSGNVSYSGLGKYADEYSKSLENNLGMIILSEYQKK